MSFCKSACSFALSLEDSTGGPVRPGPRFGQACLQLWLFASWVILGLPLHLAAVGSCACSPSSGPQSGPPVYPLWRPRYPDCVSALQHHFSFPVTWRDFLQMRETPTPKAQARDGRNPTAYVWERPRFYSRSLSKQVWAPQCPGPVLDAGQCERGGCSPCPPGAPRLVVSTDLE